MASIPSGLAEAMAAIARTLARADTLKETLERVARLSVEVIPDVDYAGVSLVDPAGLITFGATAPVVKQLDTVQQALLEGPCFAAAEYGRSQYAADLAKYLAWPRFGPAAVLHGVRSVLAFPLSLNGRCIGTLNLFSARANAISSDDMEVAAIFAAHAAVAVASASAHAKEVEARRQLEAALDTRDILSIAKGIVMERQHLNESQAFDVLYRASVRLNRKLHDVAADIVTLGPRASRQS